MKEGALSFFNREAYVSFTFIHPRGLSPGSSQSYPSPSRLSPVGRILYKSTQAVILTLPFEPLLYPAKPAKTPNPDVRPFTAMRSPSKPQFPTVRRLPSSNPRWFSLAVFFQFHRLASISNTTLTDTPISRSVFLFRIRTTCCKLSFVHCGNSKCMNDSYKLRPDCPQTRAECDLLGPPEMQTVEGDTATNRSNIGSAGQTHCCLLVHLLACCRGFPEGK